MEPGEGPRVAWRPWGDEAFAEARRLDRPILLAIGAVWCHWCHVMDRTSYSDPAVVAAINERCVPVRVDRDERPDIDRRYNLGGWPTTAFLTPDGEIIHGGTYVPPETMGPLVERVAEVWREQRGEIERRVAELRQRTPQSHPAGELSWDIVRGVVRTIRDRYDRAYGGFGSEPKFPQPQLLRLLLDEHARGGDPDVAEMLHRTLGAMAAGGMYDAVEGGFFRYSTTRDWSVPHFEKMLEDNAPLLAVYAEAHRAFPDAGYDRIVRDVIRWLEAVLWREDAGMFGGSQDADEHYYALGAEERARHDAPFVDRRLYTGWNALAASAYLAAATALADPALEERGRRVVRAIAERMTVGGAVMHVDVGDGPTLDDLLADLAPWLAALLDAYETGRDPEALERALAVAARLRDRLGDPAGGLWDAPRRDDAPGLLSLREKPLEEGSLAADALLRLAALSGEEAWRDLAVAVLGGFVAEHARWGPHAAGYARAVARALAEPVVISVVGPDDDEHAEALWAAARSADVPARALHRLVPARDAVRLSAQGLGPARTAAYVCVGTVCTAPLDDARGLAEAIRTATRDPRKETTWPR